MKNGGVCGLGDARIFAVCWSNIQRVGKKVDDRSADRLYLSWKCSTGFVLLFCVRVCEENGFSCWFWSVAVFWSLEVWCLKFNFLLTDWFLFLKFVWFWIFKYIRVKLYSEREYLINSNVIGKNSTTIRYYWFLQ